MTHKTKGIVLRCIKYGETSVVATIFTEKFGVQSYIVNGIRTQKKTGSKAAQFQPAALLELEVYHNEFKNLHRIKESNWAFLYNNVFSDVIKNTIALYIIELLTKTLKQPEQNSDLFYFCEDSLMKLDTMEVNIAANFPLFFSLHLPQFFGLRISSNTFDLTHKDRGENQEIYFDLTEGKMDYHQPIHKHFIEGENAIITAEILKAMLPQELGYLKLNHHTRKALLLKYQEYYAMHFSDFGQMKTLQVLHEVLS